MKALPPPSQSSNINQTDPLSRRTRPTRPSVPENSKDATSLRKTQHHTAGDRQADIRSPHQPSKSKSAGLLSLAAAAFDDLECPCQHLRTCKYFLPTKPSDFPGLRCRSANQMENQSGTTSSSSSSANYPDRTCATALAAPIQQLDIVLHQPKLPSQKGDAQASPFYSRKTVRPPNRTADLTQASRFPGRCSRRWRARCTKHRRAYYA